MRPPEDPTKQITETAVIQPTYCSLDLRLGALLQFRRQSIAMEFEASPRSEAPAAINSPYSRAFEDILSNRS